MITKVEHDKSAPFSPSVSFQSKLPNQTDKSKDFTSCRGSFAPYVQQGHNEYKSSFTTNVK